MCALRGRKKRKRRKRNTHLLLALKRLMQENHEFKASLAYKERSHLERKRK